MNTLTGNLLKKNLMSDVNVNNTYNLSDMWLDVRLLDGAHERSYLSLHVRLQTQ